ncbi:MAG: RluA family pseudouridine synthase [Sphaerochaeta sp.]
MLKDNRFFNIAERVLYEDNHIIMINKLPGEIVQADKTGDASMLDDVKAYLKAKYHKPGNVFLGLPHRIDRPTSGIVLFARTDKALSRLSEMFRTGQIDKYYWAVADRSLPSASGELVHYIYRDTVKNKSFAFKPALDGGIPDLHGVKKSELQLARLRYEQIGQSDRYVLLNIELLTGRHHQIRAQLAACGAHIKGDLKYGFPRSESNGGICLHSHEMSFVHPVSKETIHITARPPEERIWSVFDLTL